VRLVLLLFAIAVCGSPVGCAPEDPRRKAIVVPDLPALYQLHEKDPVAFAAEYVDRPLEFNIRVDEIATDSRGTLTLVQKSTDPKAPLEVYVEDVPRAAGVNTGETVTARARFRRAYERRLFLAYGEVTR